MTLQEFEPSTTENIEPIIFDKSQCYYQGRYPNPEKEYIDSFVLPVKPTGKFFVLPEGIFNIESIHVYLNLNSLNNENFILKKTFKIKLKIEPGNYFGEIKELGLYASGSTLEEIIEELQYDLIDNYECFSVLPDNELGTEPLNWKKILVDSIEKVNE